MVFGLTAAQPQCGPECEEMDECSSGYISDLEGFGTRCSVRDSDCITRQVQLKTAAITSNVMSEMTARSLDPLIIDAAEIDFAGLKINFYKGVVNSLSGFEVDKIEINPEAKQMHLVAHTDAVVQGRYSIDGNVLGFKVDHDGDAAVDSKNFQIEFVIPFDIVKDASGRNVFDLKGYQYTYDIKDKVEYNIGNLFPGYPGINWGGFDSRCSVLDSDCITKQVQVKTAAITSNVMSEMTARSLDPLIIDAAEIDFAGLKINFYKGVVKSLSGFEVDKVDIDPQARQMRVVAHTDASVQGRYSIDGKVLGFNINQDGNAEVDSKNFQIEFVMPFDVVKDALGRNVFDLKGYQYTYDIKDRVDYNFGDLFPGYKTLSNTMHQFINTRWSKAILTTYGKPVLDKVTAKIFNSFRSYLLTQPIDEFLY
ncbi:unnamed protein product [Leptosia nina]|uniref:Circadian clock-controlled protein n=1 Tax=Leptosia nina TaxID=320188 RepID=A0AAV1K0Q3_9NEOP